MRSALPFQSTPDRVIRVLQDARRLLASPERWCRGRLAQGCDGRHRKVVAPDVHSFCLEGAILCAASEDPAAEKDAQRVLREVIGIPRGCCRALFDWNDALTRKHAEVIQALDDAIENAEWIMQPREVLA